MNAGNAGGNCCAQKNSSVVGNYQLQVGAAWILPEAEPGQNRRRRIAGQVDGGQPEGREVRVRPGGSQTRGRMLLVLFPEDVRHKSQQRVTGARSHMTLQKRMLRELVGLAPDIEQKRRILRPYGATVIALDHVLALHADHQTADEALVQSGGAGKLPLADGLPCMNEQPADDSRALGCETIGRSTRVLEAIGFSLNDDPQTWCDDTRVEFAVLFGVVLCVVLGGPAEPAWLAGLVGLVGSAGLAE